MNIYEPQSDWGFSGGAPLAKKAVNSIVFKIAIPLITILATIAGAEVIFRSLLFNCPSLMDRWRRPGLYADAESDDNYWKLRVFFGASPAKRDDPLLGYVKPDITPADYYHREAQDVGGRKPVLLYGDSFAQGVAPPRDRFEGILNARTGFNGNYHLLNYGVIGYGLDQIYLLYSKSVGHYADPVVIFSLLDGDIDRCVLSMREGQKPYFLLNEGRLELNGLPIESDQNRFFSQRPPDIGCYLCNLAWFAVLPNRLDPNYPAAPRTSQKKRIAQAILLEAANDLRRRNLRYVFLVFEGMHRTWQRPLNWRISFLSDLFCRHGIPHIWARRAIERRVARNEFHEADYVVEDQHPNGRANALVADRITDWLRTGEADHDDD
ncbi:MAG: hypothetical protein ABSF52_12015 [Syntrophobacteraceae bacterium]